MNNTSKNAVSDGLVGSTVTVGYGALPPATPLTVGQVYTTNNTGTAGQFLTSGSNGTSWGAIGSTGSYSIRQPYDAVMTVSENPASLQVSGKVVINGLDLEERLKTIEKVLMIPERDATMEAKYPSLKKKFDEYINALEKYKTFERIKGTYD
jgi:hypothetical protein